MSSKAKKGSQKNSPKNSRSDSPKSGLPFEPVSDRKKTPKKPPSATPKQVKAESTAKPAPSAAKQATSIPQVVSSRMARRMGFFCGIPTSFGMLTFVASYFIVTNHWLKIPNVAVVLVSMGFFGLGVLGLTYGVLSASWDEERVGSWHGWEEFSVNFNRTLESWRAARQKPSI